jgi:predicted nucleic acid-binding protein
MSAEPQIFVDTNILVYAFDRSAGQKHTLALQLMEECWENENGCLSIQVLQEFFVNVTQKIFMPLDLQTARQIVADLAHWHLHTPEASDLLQAIDYMRDHRLSFWDAMILQSAARLACVRLFSEDLNHGQSYGNVRVINPFFRE